MLVSLCLCGCVFGSSVLQSDYTDKQILTMGYPKWIQRIQQQSANDLDQLSDAEYKFALAMARANDELIALSSQAESLKNLQTLFANLTKGACRLADYLLYNNPKSAIYYRKSETLSALTLNSYIHHSHDIMPIQQSDVWESFRKAREIHQSNSERIQQYVDRFGGYSVERYSIEFQRVGSIMKMIFKAISGSNADQKRHVFILCQRMVELTTGQDPLPYATAGQHPMAK